MAPSSRTVHTSTSAPKLPDLPTEIVQKILIQVALDASELVYREQAQGRQFWLMAHYDCLSERYEFQRRFAAPWFRLAQVSRAMSRLLLPHADACLKLVEEKHVGMARRITRKVDCVNDGEKCRLYQDRCDGCTAAMNQKNGWSILHEVLEDMSTGLRKVSIHRVTQLQNLLLTSAQASRCSSKVVTVIQVEASCDMLARSVKEVKLDMNNLTAAKRETRNRHQATAQVNRTT